MGTKHLSGVQRCRRFYFDPARDLLIIAKGNAMFHLLLKKNY